MSVTVAMLFLVEAATACGPVAPARLGGGAEVVRAILDVEEQAPEQAVSTPTNVSQPTGAAPGDATPETDDLDPHPAPPAQCKPARMPIA